MSAEGIPCSSGYNPLYKHDLFKASIQKNPLLYGCDEDKADYSQLYLPVTERVCDEEAVWFGQNMLLGPQEDMDDIVEAIKKIEESFTQ